MSLDLTHTALQIDHMSENIKNHRQTHINKIAKALEEEANGDFELAKSAAIEGINDVEKLLINHTEAV